MAGEQLQRTRVERDGIPGDRTVIVRDDRRVLTSRSRPRLLLHRATLADDGTALVDNRPWHAESVAADVREAAGQAARLVRDDTLERFDILPLLVITDGALAAFGRDKRRLRPNLIIAGVEGVAEFEWPGRTLAIGDARIRLASRRERCIMTTFDPDTAGQDRNVLLDIHARFGGKIALDAEILVPGEIAVGDAVTLI
jgi:uncharacterized protein YcbX